MNDINLITLLAVILGSVLGFVATLVSSQITDRNRQKAKAKAHIIYLKLEFADVLKLLDTIRTSYEHQRYYDYLLLGLLDKTINNLQDARRKSYLLSDEKLQEDVFTIINRVALLSQEMRGIQEYAHSKAVTTDEKTGQERTLTAIEKTNREKLIEEKRTSHMIEIVDLKREVKHLNDRL